MRAHTSSGLVQLTRIGIVAGLGLGMMLLVGCNKPPEPPKERFPGYTQAAPSGEGSRIFVNKSGVRRDGKLWRLPLVETDATGYVIFDLVTNCKTGFARDAGQRYQNDGIAGAPTPTDTKISQTAKHSDMEAAVQAGCEQARGQLAITGQFTTVEAVSALFDDVVAEQGVTEEAHLTRDTGSGNPEEFEGKRTLTRLVKNQPFTQKGVEKMMVVLQTIPDNGAEGFECHACSPILGLAIFVKVPNGWQIESSDPFVVSSGSYGKVGDANWVESGTGTFSLLLHDSGGGMGEFYERYDVLTPSASGWNKTLSWVGANLESTTAAFVKGTDLAHYDVRIDVKVAAPDPSAPAEDPNTAKPDPPASGTLLFRYANGKYVAASARTPVKP